MSPDPNDNRLAYLASLVTAAAMIAFQVAAKATRDALFLSTFGMISLPLIVMLTALLAIGFAFLSARALTVWGPGRVIPVAFGVSAALLLVEWGISLWFPKAAAVLLYVHCGCLGGLLVSGFWSFVNERFDPRTAKRQLGPISAWGTVGGLLGGLVAERVGHALPVTAMLPILAAFHVVSAVSVTQIRLGAEESRQPSRARVADDPGKRVRSGLKVITDSGYVRGLMGLVLLVTVSEGFLDFAVKSRADAAFGRGADLLRFFAILYTAISLLTLLVQSLVSGEALEKFGPARTAAALPAGAAVASAGALIAPGLGSAALARGTEAVLSNSLYRPGYEVLFTPVSPREKRAVKPLADVGAARVGDLAAAGVAQIVLLISIAHAPLILTAMAFVVSGVAVLAAMRLHEGYKRSLAGGLRSRAIELDLSEVRDGVTRSIVTGTLDPFVQTLVLQSPKEPPSASPRSEREPGSDTQAQVLRSAREGPISPALVHQLISLLGKDDAAREVIEVLRRAGPVSVEPLVARLLDPREVFVVRRRIPLVLATCKDPRAVEGLARGLGDARFEVRYRCARGLSHLMDLDPGLRVASPVAFAAVLREVEAGAAVWEGRRVLDQLDDESWSPVVDGVIRERANRSLEHVFTLLALVLPREPLRIAFRALHVNDDLLRGTALEYLVSALPAEIRTVLWPYLEDKRPRRPLSARTAEEALARLMESSDSIVIRLEELKRVESTPAPGPR